MTAKECIIGRRSIRRFTGQPVPHSVPGKDVATAAHVPSRKNTQGSYSTNRGGSWQLFDAGAACEAFCISAYEQKLGTVPVSPKRKTVADLLSDEERVGIDT